MCRTAAVSLASRDVVPQEDAAPNDAFGDDSAAAGDLSEVAESAASEVHARVEVCSCPIFAPHASAWHICYALLHPIIRTGQSTCASCVLMRLEGIAIHPPF